MPIRTAAGVAVVAVLCVAGACTPGGSAESGAASSDSTTAAGTTGSSPTKTGSSTTAPATESSGTAASTDSSGTASGDATASCVQELAAALSDRDKVGQLLMVGLDAGAGAPSVRRAVTSHGVGGVVFLGGWTGGAQSVKTAAAQVNKYASGPKLFVAADQEGGQVQQLRGPGFTSIPSAQRQAELGPKALAKAAAGWAEGLAGAGVNVNLSPVADTVPADIGTANGPIGRFHREYGSTPEAVGPLVSAFVEGMHQGGVATTVKHFPGIGRITGNTDTSASGITDTVATVDDPFLEPFRAGIDAGTDFVMVGSAKYPKIAAAQALFAPEIVSDLLRGTLGYGGVVITDDVGAAAALARVPVGERATRFIAAGGDIVLTARTSDIPVMSAALLKRAGESRFADKVDAAVLRILTLKTARGLTSCSG